MDAIKAKIVELEHSEWCFSGIEMLQDLLNLLTKADKEVLSAVKHQYLKKLKSDLVNYKDMFDNFDSEAQGSAGGIIHAENCGDEFCDCDPTEDEIDRLYEDRDFYDTMSRATKDKIEILSKTVELLEEVQ
ncbi:hypothetical protein BC832DRAFT_594507 [Gaertneriomyces semiglobifer]|nr:hypothetical protein BC832DRAFT_594507 [Gaertneriomyces semiglobifer]